MTSLTHLSVILYHPVELLREVFDFIACPAPFLPLALGIACPKSSNNYRLKRQQPSPVTSS